MFKWMKFLRERWAVKWRWGEGRAPPLPSPVKKAESSVPHFSKSTQKYYLHFYSATATFPVTEVKVSPRVTVSQPTGQVIVLLT